MNYLQIESRRAFINIKFLMGIMGVIAVHFFSIYKTVGIKNSVYSTYEAATYFMPYILSLSFCLIPYVQSLTEDIEHRYIYQIGLRMSLKSYVFIKCIVIYVSATMTMLSGTLLFIFLIRIRVPWIHENDILVDNPLIQILNHNYIIYFIIRAFFMGLLAACIAIIAMYISLYWNSYFFVLSLPLLIFCFSVYFANYIFENIPQIDVSQCFNPALNIWGDITISCIYPVILSCFVFALLRMLILKRVRRIYYGENTR